MIALNKINTQVEALLKGVTTLNVPSTDGLIAASITVEGTNENKISADVDSSSNSSNYARE